MSTVIFHGDARKTVFVKRGHVTAPRCRCEICVRVRERRAFMEGRTGA